MSLLDTAMVRLGFKCKSAINFLVEYWFIFPQYVILHSWTNWQPSLASPAALFILLMCSLYRRSYERCSTGLKSHQGLNLVSNQWHLYGPQRQVETVHFMQVVPWLGVVPNKEGQLQQLLADDNFSPLVSIFKQSADEVVLNPSCVNPNAFVSMAKQAQVAGILFYKFFGCTWKRSILKFPKTSKMTNRRHEINWKRHHFWYWSRSLRYEDHEIVVIIVCADILYMNNLQTGSILDYTLAYLGAVLARVREKWDQPSKTGLIEITTSREYYRIYSGFQFVSNFDSFLRLRLRELYVHLAWSIVFFLGEGVLNVVKCQFYKCYALILKQRTPLPLRGRRESSACPFSSSNWL